jgi:hypothetical protein
VDPMKLTAGRTGWFPGTVVTVRRCGPDGGDSGEDGVVPGHNNDVRATWTWRR